MDDFGTTLKKLRKQKRITQRDLAERIGVDFTYISKIENGQLKNTPAIQTIEKIADVLEADPNELILLADKIPTEFKELIMKDELAVRFLRSMPKLQENEKKAINRILRGEKSDK